MAVKKVESFNIHETPAINQNMFDVETYLNANWKKTKEAVNNNAEELMQVQKDISTLKEDNKTNKSSIDVLEKSNETRDGKISKNAEDIEAIQGSIKTAIETINKKDNEQDDSITAIQENIKTINSENERLREDIKSIAIVNEASGENIHIEDSSEARCEIEIGGNQKQETREGYNQFKITSTQTQSAGVTITKIDESSVSYQGTTTGMFTHMLVEYDGKGLEITKQMYLKAFGNLTNAILSVKLIKNGKTESSYLRVSPDLILSAGDVLQQIYVQQQNTGILISGTLQVLLTDYENKDKPYEQYGASPSIPYPSPVKNVGNIKNILDMSNAKNGSSAGIACTMNADGSYKYKGTATSQYINVWFMGGYATDLPTLFTLEPGTYYINDVSLFEGTTGFANDSSKKIWTFIRAYNVTGVRAPNAISGNTYDETKYPIIAKIDHEIPWVPYEMGYIKVNEFNKNYLSTIPQMSFSLQGIQTTFDGEKFICKGTAMYNYFNLTTKRIAHYFKVGTYTFSSNVFAKGRACIRFYYKDGTADTYYSNINTRKTSFTLKKDAYEYFLMVDGLTVGGGDLIDCIIKLQLEDGNTATEIEKAENQEYLVDVQQPMFEGDTFVKQDAKWCEKHNWKTMSFDGQNVASQAGGTFADFKENGNIVRTFEIKDLLISSVRNDIFCDKLPRQADSMWNGRSTGIQSWQGQNKILISLPFDDVEKKYGQKLTVDNYITAFYMYLQNEVLIISYPLAEPILLECTEAQSKVLDEIYNKAHTYKNITNISAESSEVNPIVSLKYLKDVETEHNKLQAQIDEIKQLLSTTETSAMLLNNMQTDLESEV